MAGKEYSALDTTVAHRLLEIDFAGRLIHFKPVRAKIASMPILKLDLPLKEAQRICLRLSWLLVVHAAPCVFGSTNAPPRAAWIT